MPSMTLRGHSACLLCGYRRATVRFSQIDILANTLRERPGALIFTPGNCQECGWPEPHGYIFEHVRYYLDPEDVARIKAVRERRKAKRRTARTSEDSAVSAA